MTVIPLGEDFIGLRRGRAISHFRITFAFIFLAFSFVITFSNAAGMRISTGSSSNCSCVIGRPFDRSQTDPEQ